MQWCGFFLSICVTMNHSRWWKRKRDLSSSRSWTDHHEWRQARGWSCKVSSARKWDPSSQHVTSSAVRVMRRVKNHMPISVGVCVSVTECCPHPCLFSLPFPCLSLGPLGESVFPPRDPHLVSRADRKMFLAPGLSCTDEAAQYYICLNLLCRRYNYV